MAEEKRDYWAAFAIGAIVGIGATLLLAPEQPTGARRILRDIEPALRHARKGGGRMTRQARNAARSLRKHGTRARQALRYR